MEQIQPGSSYPPRVRSKMHNRLTELVKQTNSLAQDNGNRPEDFSRAKECFLNLFFAVHQPELGAPEDYLCPISGEIMSDPVIISSGETYQRKPIKSWFDLGFNWCFKSEGFVRNKDLIQNKTLKKIITDWLKEEKDAVLREEAEKGLVLGEAEKGETEEEEKISDEETEKGVLVVSEENGEADEETEKGVLVVSEEKGEADEETEKGVLVVSEEKGEAGEEEKVAEEEPEKEGVLVVSEEREGAKKKIGYSKAVIGEELNKNRFAVSGKSFLRRFKNGKAVTMTDQESGEVYTIVYRNGGKARPYPRFEELDAYYAAKSVEKGDKLMFEFVKDELVVSVTKP